MTPAQQRALATIRAQLTRLTRYDAYEVHDCAPSHRLPAGPPGRQLAWVLDNPVVCSPIVGATKPHHLTEAVAALGLHLTDDEIHALQEPYTPHGPSWF